MATNKNGSGLNNPVNESQGGTNASTFTQARINMLLAHVYQLKTNNYLALTTDLNKFLRFTGAGPYTLTLTAAATLGTQWQVAVRNDTAANLTIDPNGGELINGAATLTLEVGQAILIQCDGAGFYTSGQAAAIDGANQALSNLTNPTSVNQDLIPSANATNFLGTFGKSWAALFAVALLADQTGGSQSSLAAYDGLLTAYKNFFTVTSGAPGNAATGVIDGSVTGTTQPLATNTTQLATCAFVLANAGGGGGLAYVNQNSSSVTMAANTRYGCNNGASLITFTMPAAAAAGDVFEIIGNSAGGWTLTCGVGQNIRFGSIITTATAGALASSNRGDCVVITCIVANTTFSVNSSIGNITWA